MPKKVKKGRSRLDKFYHLAKEHGFRARSAFKLIQLNKKYDFLANSKCVIDLCAAPGGWLQVCAKYMPMQSLIIGVDLMPIKPIRGCTTLKEDITTQKCRLALKKLCKEAQADVVLHDGSPNVGANWVKDAYVQSELTLASLRLAVEFLRPGGMFITKIFRSQDYTALLWVLNKLFKKVEATKPPASRSTSAEIYAVCHGYLAPSKIDPRLLDPRHVFKAEGSEPQQAMDIFQPEKRTRKRQGYEDDSVLQWKRIPVSKFIETDKPIELLGSCHTLIFDKDSQIYANHTATNQEIKLLCEDLKVIGKSDFKALLKWRLKMVQYRDELMGEKENEKDEDEDEDEDEDGDEVDEDEETKDGDSKKEDDEDVDAELSELERKLLQKEKRQKKKEKEKKAKLQRRIQGAGIDTDPITSADADDLFQLRKIHNVTLDSLDDASIQQIEDVEDGDVVDAPSEEDGDAGDDIYDSEEEQFAALEQDMDAMYEQYKKRRNIKTKADKQKERQVGLQDDEEEDQMPMMADDEDGDADGNRLIVSGPAESAAKRAERWFSNDLFDGINLDITATSKKPESKDDDDEDDEDREDAGDGDDADDEEEDGDEDGDEEEDDEDVPAAKKSRVGLSAKLSRPLPVEKKSRETESMPLPNPKKDKDAKKKGKNDKKKNEPSFEEVPLESDYSSDSDAIAEALAIGRAMLNKKAKNDMIDDAYNRYAFNDPSDLPEWFVEDEKKHNTPQLPVSKDQVDFFKEQLQAINARPIKKIAEAKARKKMKAMKKWEQLKGKAQQIADNPEMNASQKLKSIQSLYKGKKEAKKKDKNYVVVAKNGVAKNAKGGKKGARTKLVDKRLKKDKRAQKASNRKSKKVGGKRKR